MEEFKIKAEENGLSVVILESLPELYINPYADKYKLFKNVKDNKEEYDIGDVLKSYKV
jgi:hypothetical protein